MCTICIPSHMREGRAVTTKKRKKLICARLESALFGVALKCQALGFVWRNKEKSLTAKLWLRDLWCLKELLFWISKVSPQIHLRTQG